MPSPFPGMDPYLEAPTFWGGFHARLYNTISAALNRSLPPGYFAEIDEHVWLQTAEAEDRRILGKPDVFVTGRNGATTPTSGAGRATVTAPSARVVLPKRKKRTQRYVKVVAPDHTTVVTVIEVLSPSNKEGGPDRDAYLAKRNEYLALVNLVEIDLLRGGGRLPMGDPVPAGDYYVFVCRATAHPAADVWAFTVRDSLPTLPVPLKARDGHVPLDLQACVTDIYDTNRYAERIDYSAPILPALRKLDAEWAAELLKKHARKKK